MIDFDMDKVKKTGETIQETFDRWEREWKKEHPVLNFIDEKILKGKGIAHYRGSHALTHPWLIVEYACQEIKYAWQRVFRGWDDTLIWSVDHYLAETIPVWVREIKKYKDGIPMQFFREDDDYLDTDGMYKTKPGAWERAEKEYSDVLDKIAMGFEAYTKMGDIIDYYSDEYKEQEKIFNEGFDLFKKYFSTLGS
jgi:hypothetical protein